MGKRCRTPRAKNKQIKNEACTNDHDAQIQKTHRCPQWSADLRLYKCRMFSTAKRKVSSLHHRQLSRSLLYILPAPRPNTADILRTDAHVWCVLTVCTTRSRRPVRETNNLWRARYTGGPNVQNPAPGNARGRCCKDQNRRASPDSLALLEFSLKLHWDERTPCSCSYVVFTVPSAAAASVTKEGMIGHLYSSDDEVARRAIGWMSGEKITHRKSSALPLFFAIKRIRTRDGSVEGSTVSVMGNGSISRGTRA